MLQRRRDLDCIRNCLSSVRNKLVNAGQKLTIVLVNVPQHVTNFLCKSEQHKSKS